MLWWSHTRPLPFVAHRLTLTRLFQRGAEVLPKPTPELLLSRSGRGVSRLVTGPVAWCTWTLEAQGGPEGRGAAAQLPVWHGRPERPALRCQPSLNRLRWRFRVEATGPGVSRQALTTVGHSSEASHHTATLTLAGALHTRRRWAANGVVFW